MGTEHLISDLAGLLFRLSADLPVDALKLSHELNNDIPVRANCCIEGFTRLLIPKGIWSLGSLSFQTEHQLRKLYTSIRDGSAPFR